MMNWKKIQSSRSKNKILLFTGATLAALLALPTLGSAAVSSGYFTVKATDTKTPEITATAGMDGKADTETPEIPTTGEPNQTTFTLDTRFEGCTAPRLNLTSSDPSTVIDWGDGSSVTGITPGTHSYATPKIYKVTVTGRIDSIRSVPVESANCFKSLDYIGEETGLTMMYASFQDAAHIEYVAKPPSTINYLGSLFRNSGFNGDISNWDTSKVTDMSRMFEGATKFNQPIGDWNMGKVRALGQMFAGATSFNQPIGDWNMASAFSIDGMFRGATSFNQDLRWTTPILGLNLRGVFEGATAFNGDVSTWDVSRAVDFGNAFRNAESFNQDISVWNVSEGRTFDSMFEGATSFNQPIDRWTTTKASGMKAMFKGAITFDQNLSGWTVTGVPLSQPDRWSEFAPHLDSSKIPSRFSS